MNIDFGLAITIVEIHLALLVNSGLFRADVAVPV